MKHKCDQCGYSHEMKKDHHSLKNKLKKIDKAEKKSENKFERSEEKIFKKHPSLISAKEAREKVHANTVKKALKDADKKHDKKKLKSKSKVKTKNKISKVMHEYKERELHSGSKRGPIVRNSKQAIAIALSEARHMKKRK